MPSVPNFDLLFHHAIVKNFNTITYKLQFITVRDSDVCGSLVLSNLVTLIVYFYKLAKADAFSNYKTTYRLHFLYYLASFISLFINYSKYNTCIMDLFFVHLCVPLVFTNNTRCQNMTSPRFSMVYLLSLLHCSLLVTS